MPPVSNAQPHPCQGEGDGLAVLETEEVFGENFERKGRRELSPNAAAL
jgi:hypothetical protein